jgi:hypothetical protein
MRASGPSLSGSLDRSCCFGAFGEGVESKGGCAVGRRESKKLGEKEIEFVLGSGGYSTQESKIQTNSVTVAIQSPTVAGEINLAPHLGQSHFNFRTRLSHFLQTMTDLSAFNLDALLILDAYAQKSSMVDRTR